MTGGRVRSKAGGYAPGDAERAVMPRLLREKLLFHLRPVVRIRGDLDQRLHDAAWRNDPGGHPVREKFALATVATQGELEDEPVQIHDVEDDDGGTTVPHE